MKKIPADKMQEFRAHLSAACQLMHEHGALFTATFTYIDQDGDVTGGGSHHIDGKILRDHASSMDPSHRMMYTISSSEEIVKHHPGLTLEFNMSVNGNEVDGFLIDHDSMMLSSHVEELTELLGQTPGDLTKSIREYNELLTANDSDPNAPDVITARNDLMAYVVSQIALARAAAPTAAAN